jgi:hypothetical protein
LAFVNLRTDEGIDRPARAGTYLVWAVVALAIVAGVALALALGPRMTPLLDTLR